MSEKQNDLIQLADELLELLKSAGAEEETILHADRLLKNIKGDFNLVFSWSVPEGIPTPRPDQLEPKRKAIDPLDLLFNAANDELLVWAEGYAQLRGAPRVSAEVSKLIWDKLGFEPYGTKKSWLGMMSLLLEAAKGNLSLVERGAVKALEAKNKGGISLNRPVSIVGFIRGAAAEDALKASKKTIKL